MRGHSRGRSPGANAPIAVVVTQYFPPDSGAGARRARAFVRYLQGKGYEVRVVCGMPNYPARRVHKGYRWRLWRRERVGGVPVLRIRALGIRCRGLIARSASEMLFTLSVGMGLVGLRRVDLMILTTPSQFLILAGLMAKATRGCSRLVVDVRDLTFLVLDSRKPGSMPAVIGRWLHRAFCIGAARADLVVAVSSAIADRLRDDGAGDSVRVLRNGIDVESIVPPRRCRQGAGPVTFVYAGLVGRLQGVDLLVRAAALLERDDIVVRIVGEGQDKAALATLIEESRLAERVLLSSSVPLDDVPALLASADAAVITLRPEFSVGCSPTKLFDAMAAGLPIVYAGEGDGADTARQAECGIVLPWGDPSALAQALLWMADNPDGRQSMGMRGQEFAKSSLMRGAFMEVALGDLAVDGSLKTANDAAPQPLTARNHPKRR